MEKFNLTYDWFDKTMTSALNNAIGTYFETNFDTMLVSLDSTENLKLNPIFKNELFYTCRISIKNKQHLTLRATSDFIRIVFHDMFGSSYPVFDLEKLTELEGQILNSFFEMIVKNIEPFLIKETEQSKIDPLNKENVNLIFFIKNKEINVGKICINIPLNRVLPKEINLAQSFIFDDFIENFAYADIVCGMSKISLSDLKNLAEDDILLLENSDIKLMTLKTETVKKEFKVNPEPSIMLDLDEGEEEIDEYKESNMPETKTMWDDIQIEVTAEFKKVKMSLGDLKQISKGLVIDLGAVMNNEISLLVENKTVAKGELVIINDKYGVKINQVLATQNPAGQAEETAPEQKAKLPNQPQAPISQQKPPVQAPPQGAPQPGAIQGAPHPMPPSRPQPRPVPQGARPAQPPQGARPAPKPLPQRTPAKPAPKPAQQGAKENFDYSNFEE